MSDSIFLRRLKEGKTLVSDGATGTNLQARGLDKGASGEIWVLENPQEIVKLHTDFIDAGADIILTCSFGGSRLRLEQKGIADRMGDINQRAAELARQAVEGTQTLVAGSIGPLGQLLKPLGTIEVEQAFSAYAEQAKALAEGGVDFLLIETQFDLAEAKTALEAARSVSDLPLVCSFSYDRGTRTMMGVKPEQMAAEIGALDVAVLGINCGRSLDDNLQSLRQLREATDLPIWFKPNAGLPTLDENGNPVYDVDPAQMGAQAVVWVETGAQIVGGCCGTSPEHLGRIAQAVKKG